MRNYIAAIGSGCQLLVVQKDGYIRWAANNHGFHAHQIPACKAANHDDKQQKGELRLDTLSRDFGTHQVAQRWAEVLFRINAGEMPPKKELQPKAEELGKVAGWISAGDSPG